MLTPEQKEQLYDLMYELPNYVDEQEAKSAATDLVRATDDEKETLYKNIFEKKIWSDYPHPSVYIKRFFDKQ